MAADRWSQVDAYFAALLPRDGALEGALERSRKAGLPDIAVAPNQGRLLEILARATAPRRILEIGALGGYSTIWLARALQPGGRVVSLEIDPHHAEVARDSVAAAGLSDRVEIRIGRALDLLPRLVEESAGPFDFVFIDADKTANADYFGWALKLARPGTLIVVDNVVRGGAVVSRGGDADVRGVRRLVDLVADEAGVAATVIQTVGGKGYDGFLIAEVTGGR